LERIDVEDFVFPRQLLLFEAALNVRPLAIIRGDDTEGHATRFIQLNELHDNMSFFVILVTNVRKALMC